MISYTTDKVGTPLQFSECIYSMHTMYFLSSMTWNTRKQWWKALQLSQLHVWLSLHNTLLYCMYLSGNENNATSKETKQLWTCDHSLWRLLFYKLLTVKTRWHRVVILVADKLEDSGYERFAVVLETNCPRGSCQVHLTTTIHMRTLITSVLPSPGYEFLAATLKCICNDSFTDVLRVVSVLHVVVIWTGQLPIGLPYAICF